MDQSYKLLQSIADRLQYRTRDMIGIGDDPVCKEIAHVAEDVREDLEKEGPPRSVEARILQLLQLLNRDMPSIAADKSNALLGDYEDLRRQLRGLPNY